MKRARALLFGLIVLLSLSSAAQGHIGNDETADGDCPWGDGTHLHVDSGGMFTESCASTDDEYRICVAGECIWVVT